MDRLANTQRISLAAQGHAFEKQVYGRSQTKRADTPPSNNKAPSQETDKTHVRAKEIVGSFGFGTLLSWMILSYFGDTFVGGFDSFIDTGLTRFLSLLVFAFVFSLFLGRSDYLMTIDLRKLAIPTLVLALALPLCVLLASFSFSIPSFVLYVSWLLNGLATAFAFLMWAHYYGNLSKDNIVSSIVAVCVITGFWSLMITFLPKLIMIAGSYLSLLLSVVCLLVFMGESTVPAFVSRKDSETIIGLNIKTSVCLIVVGVAFGYVVCHVGAHQPLGIVYVLSASFALNGIFTFVVKKISGSFSLLLAPVLRFAFPFVVLGFLLMPFLDGFALLVCEVLLLSVLIEHWVSAFINISYAIQKYKIQTFYLWIRVNMTFIIGAALGWGMGLFSVYSIAEYGADPFLMGIVILLILVFAFVVVATIAPYGIDHLTIRRNFEARSEIGDQENHKKAWWTACNTVAVEANLTPRETEVFFLLAKGRNSKVIERELSISSHTVKSHNYNIYKKLGVVSQQELIDVVETCRFELRS